MAKATDIQGTCASCGQKKSVRDRQVPGPSEGTATYEAKLCTSCAAKHGAK